MSSSSSTSKIDINPLFTGLIFFLIVCVIIALIFNNMSSHDRDREENFTQHGGNDKPPWPPQNKMSSHERDHKTMEASKTKREGFYDEVLRYTTLSPQFNDSNTYNLTSPFVQGAPTPRNYFVGYQPSDKIANETKLMRSLTDVL